ncbi:MULTISPECIES: hypothetical protein [Morganellaceae]
MFYLSDLLLHVIGFS